MPTNHAPDGWRFDQRPKPDNVTVIEADGAPHDVDVIVCQTGDDISAVVMDSRMGHPIDVPAFYLSHNRWEYDAHCADALNVWEWPLVCISEMKAVTWRNAGYTHPITVIPPYIDVNEYNDGWTGEGGYILTVCNGLWRKLFDLDAWIAATRDLPVKLVGDNNESIPGAVGPSSSWDHLRSLYREARCYLSVNKWPNEDGYALALLEALATGVPTVALSNPTLPEGVPHGEPWVLRASLEFLLKEPGMRMPNIAEQFPMERFRGEWLKVLESVASS